MNNEWPSMLPYYNHYMSFPAIFYFQLLWIQDSKDCNCNKQLLFWCLSKLMLCIRVWLPKTLNNTILHEFVWCIPTALNSRLNRKRQYNSQLLLQYYSTLMLCIRSWWLVTLSDIILYAWWTFHSAEAKVRALLPRFYGLLIGISTRGEKDYFQSEVGRNSWENWEIGFGPLLKVD